MNNESAHLDIRPQSVDSIYFGHRTGLGFELRREFSSKIRLAGIFPSHGSGNLYHKQQRQRNVLTWARHFGGLITQERHRALIFDNF